MISGGGIILNYDNGIAYVRGCDFIAGQRQSVGIVNDLSPGEGIFEGEFSLPVINLGDGRKAFAPMPFPNAATGKVTWKKKDGSILYFQVTQIGTCAIPGSSGLEGIKPCFQINQEKYMILLDYDPNKPSGLYRGRMEEYRYK